MNPSRPRVPRSTGLLLCMLLATTGIARSQEYETDATPMEVTTDTTAYCLTLSDQIARYGTVPREVRELQLEGRRLCGEGHVRGGVNRLRRALMVLHETREPVRADSAVPDPADGRDAAPHD